MGKPLVRFREGLESNVDRDEIVWHRRETRRQTEKTNLILQPGESPAYSNSLERGAVLKSLYGHGGAPTRSERGEGRCREGRNG